MFQCPLAFTTVVWQAESVATVKRKSESARLMSYDGKMIQGTMNSGDKLSHRLTFTAINGHICEHQANWSGSTTRMML